MINYDNMPSVKTTAINQITFILGSTKGRQKPYQLFYCAGRDGQIYLSVEHLIGMLFNCVPVPRSHRSNAFTVSPCFSFKYVKSEYYFEFHNQAVASGAKLICKGRNPFAMGIPLPLLKRFLDAIEPCFKFFTDSSGVNCPAFYEAAARRFNAFKRGRYQELIERLAPASLNKKPECSNALNTAPVRAPRAYTGRAYSVRSNPRFANAYYDWL